MPVSPIPPVVASKSGASEARVTSRSSPPGSASVNASTCAPNEPSTWWLLPWTSDAIAPPTVTCRVPGSTASDKPAGATARMTVSRLAPPPTVIVAPSPDTSIGPTEVRAMQSRTVPPPFCAASPYARPSPRAVMPRMPAAGAVSAVLTSAVEEGRITVATDGAVRPQPVRRRRVPAGIAAGMVPCSVIARSGCASTVGRRWVAAHTEGARYAPLADAARRCRGMGSR